MGPQGALESFQVEYSQRSCLNGDEPNLWFCEVSTETQDVEETFKLVRCGTNCGHRDQTLHQELQRCTRTEANPLNSYPLKSVFVAAAFWITYTSRLQNPQLLAPHPLPLFYGQTFSNQSGVQESTATL